MDLESWSGSGLAVAPGAGSGEGSRGCCSPASVGSQAAEDDPRVVRALEEYLAACERGSRPDRRRFLEDHASIASSLAACLESLDCLQRAVPHFGGSLEEQISPFVSAGQDKPPGRLGDYRLLRELGRGGMGVVFEAEHLSLGRLVALKLLPLNGAMDPRQVQRFQVEVQAAAHLHHPHIVPIHAVGCESGIHYFAMQLIPGRSLAALIGELRERAAGQSGSRVRARTGALRALASGAASSPQCLADRHAGAFFERAVRLGIQAAEALDHAHGLGVVHRDIKPANLLVELHDHLWVADFGLARLQGDSGLTATGDLVGTLRYMSPEQALARRGVVDHRTDLYSLGATLYELLTLRPAFSGGDLPTLLHQVCDEDPLPPRKIDPRIPRDLETIVLKAMAKEPVNRYATALELAEDLRRFSAGQPILVRRPSMADRAARWSRRHRGMLFSLGLMLVVFDILDHAPFFLDLT
jgi:eukaryotic-like serine/threonine-protein kinase